MKYMIVTILAIVLIGGYFINKSNNADKERLAQVKTEQMQRLEQNKTDELNAEKRLNQQKIEFENAKKLKAQQELVASQKRVKESEQARQDEVDGKRKKIEDIVKEMSFDPTAVQFRNQKGNCGEVNGKNRYGGYTGFKKYIYNPETNIVEIEDLDKFYTAEMMQILWNARCL